MTRLPRRPLIGLLACVVLLAAGALVWARGGFEGGARTHMAPPGQLLELGPYEVRAHRATAQLDYSGAWKVQVHAECRVTDEQGPRLSFAGDELFSIATSTRPRVHVERHMLQVGDEPGYGPRRDNLSPGLPPLPCLFTGTMPQGTDPRAGVTLVLASLDFGDNSVTGDQEEAWHPGDDLFAVELPVEVVTRP